MKHTTPRPVLVLLLAAAAAGCDEDSTFEVRLSNIAVATSQGEEVNVTVRDDDGLRTFRTGDFDASDAGPPRTGRFPVAESGELEIRFTWIVDGETLSDGPARWGLKKDHRWTVDIWRSETDPTLRCFGCVGSVRVTIPAPHRQTEDDAFWIVWSGLPNDFDGVL